MRTAKVCIILCSLFALQSGAADSAPLEKPAMNAPDELAWQLFVQVNASAGGSNALFETWASDSDTFKESPEFPRNATPLLLHAPVVGAVGRQVIQRNGGLLPAIPPVPDAGEEARRNKAAFDFIVKNNLYKISGLRAAFGKVISFPIDAIEVKANWYPVSKIPGFTLNRITIDQVPKMYHVNAGADGKQYALVAMHIISKLVPNWTWATFEHSLNPSRCDIIGCNDKFGAQVPIVPPNQQPDSGYSACAKSPALAALMAGAKMDPAFANYCLKGSQADFTDNTGLDMRLGNSVTESGFVDRASCMTCHGRAAFDQGGSPTSFAGFDPSGLAPLGSIDPLWYWTFNSKPPIFEGMPGLKQVGTSVDFVWSVAFCALDDTVTPPRVNSNCVGK